MAKAKGQGNIYKVGKYFYARYTLNGVKHSVPTKCTNRIEAEKFLASLVHPLQAQTEIQRLESIKAEIEVAKINSYSQMKEDSKLNFEQVEKKIKTEIKGRSSVFYLRILKIIQKFINDNKNIQNIQDFKKEDIIELLDNRKNEFGTTSRNFLLKHMKGLFRICNCDMSIFDGIKTESDEANNAKQDLTDDELKRLMVVAKGNDDIYIAFTIALNTSFRLSDVCTLKWEEINSDFTLISKIQYKLRRNGEKARVIIPITNELKEVLIKRKIKANPDDIFVIPSFANQYLKDGEVGNIHNYFDKANIKRTNDKGRAVKGFHSFRVHAITKMLSNGIPLATVMQISGHKKADICLHYNRGNIESKKEAVNSISSNFVEEKNQLEMIKNTLIQMKEGNENLYHTFHRLCMRKDNQITMAS